MASEEAQLDLRLLQRFDKSPLLAIVAETNPPKYFFIGSDSADLHFAPNKLPLAWDANVAWAHFGGISLARQPLSATLLALAKKLKQQGVKISYDPNFRNLMDARYDATLRGMCMLADVIKVSDEDLQGLFRTDDTDAAFSKLRSFNPNAIVLYTRGAAGASLHLADQSWQATPPKITVIDSIGAGDASIAGLLYSLHSAPNRGWQDHLHFSVASGAAACLAAGAQAPSLAQVQSLFEQFPTH